jgi:hypothetical protein
MQERRLQGLRCLIKNCRAQPLISNYYDATKLVVREDEEFRENLNPPPGMNHVKLDDKDDFSWTEPGETRKQQIVGGLIPILLSTIVALRTHLYNWIKSYNQFLLI